VLEETLEECGKLEITILELKDENKTLTLERDSTKKNCSKLEEALSQAPQTSNTIIYKYEKSFQKFLKNGIERSRMASMIYGVS
jgi:regulator of replication initiation timing